MDRKKVLVFGSRGRLGAALVRAWGPRHDVTGLARADVDVSDLSALERCLSEWDYDILVNGTGLTNVDACETRRDEALAVNARAVAAMADAAQSRGARLIHFSTDYVFDGEKQSPYTEDDPPFPLGWYGETKRLGEMAALEDPAGHLVVRVSWVFGPDRPGFVEQIIRNAVQSEDVSAVADKFSSPTFACDVAGWVEPFFDASLPGGLYHACNSGACSWKEYGEWALKCAAERGIPVKTTSVRPLRLADMKSFTAPRPFYTVFSTEKLTRTTGLVPRPWREALREYIHDAQILPAS